MVAGFAVELAELMEIELFELFIFALQADQVVEVAGIGQRFFEREDRSAVLNLADLL